MYKRDLKVEVSDTPSQQQQGLMFREKLGEDDGMLFKFKNPQDLKFWGINTYIPLSIAFVSKDNIIEKIDYISPGDPSVVNSVCDCDKAIEANYDFFKKNKIWVGDKISIVKNEDDTFIKF